MRACQGDGFLGSGQEFLSGPRMPFRDSGPQYISYCSGILIGKSTGNRIHRRSEHRVFRDHPIQGAQPPAAFRNTIPSNDKSAYPLRTEIYHDPGSHPGTIREFFGDKVVKYPVHMRLGVEHLNMRNGIRYLGAHAGACRARLKKGALLPHEGEGIEIKECALSANFSGTR